ncbi:MAG: ExeM/NucH family extracellular endonuclease [Anaerolineae bacterium]|jgi:hypothetical protein
MICAPASPVTADPDPSAPELLLTELVVTPTDGEFVEIHNPTGAAIDLTDVYLTDATFAGGGTNYYNIVTGSNAGGGDNYDFHARFPSGASIGAGEYRTVALAGSDDFFTEYGANPTYELYEKGETADGIPDVLEAFTGSINDQGGLTNSGEVAILYFWDGQTDLVTDLDYAVWGDKNEAVDKSEVSVDGPDVDAISSTYLGDTAIPSQDLLATGAHSSGNSWQRDDLTEGTETAAGGNGVGGDDETSEDLSNTWCENTPTPGAASNCAPAVPEVVINEIMQNPSAVSDSNGEWFELHNPTASPIDIDGWTIKDEGADEHVIDNGGPLELPAGGFLVLGNNADKGTNGGAIVDYSYGSEWYQSNGVDEVVLLDESLTEIDRVDYDGGPAFPDPNGAAMALQGPALDNNNVGDNWCLASKPYGDGDMGTPGAANDCAAPTGNWVFNEILADPAPEEEGDANGDGTRDGSDDEFVEIVNNSDAPVDISGWTLSDGSGLRHTFPDGTVVDPNCVVVVFGGGTLSGTFGAGVVQTATVGYLGLNNSGDTVTLNDGSTDQATVAYGAEGGDNQSLTRDPDVTGTFVAHSTATGSGGALFSPGTRVDGTPFFGCTCGQPATFIHDIQGSGAASPEDGNAHTIEGIVVGDFQRTTEDDHLSGFFVQEKPTDWDADDATSEGIFVYEGSSSLLDVQVGDKVRLTGTVDEQHDLTQIEDLTELGRCSAGHTTTPVTVTLPISPTAVLEAYEGMLVTMPQALAIIEFYNFDRYGEIVLGTDRQYQPTALYDPDSPEAAQLAQQNLVSRIQLEDGRTSSNPDPAIHPNGLEFDLTNRFRGGDTVKNLTGVIDYSFGAYQLEPTAGAVYTASNPRPAAPEDVGGDLKVAAFNVLNFFTTLDTGTDVCGPAGGQECRGADNATELTRQRDKLVAAMCAMDADIFGLIELENQNPANDPEPGDGIDNYVLKDLVAALNDAGSTCPDKTYDFTDSPAIGTDPIRVDIIYKTGTVTPTGRAVLTDTAFTDPNGLGDDQSRPAVAETFEDANGEALTVVVNHLKSKGTPCGSPDDDPVQGNCNDTRTKGAQALVDWLAADPTGSGDPDFLIIGDLNAYAMEDPVAELTGEGYTDLVREYQGAKAYSYVFDGQLGYLDYGLANEDLLPQVTGTTVWHINTDEPDILDYDTSYKQAAQDALYEQNAYRSSDHDPVIIGLELSTYPVHMHLPFVAAEHRPLIEPEYYFPLEVGNQWVYSWTNTVYAPSPIVETVTVSEQVGGEYTLHAYSSEATGLFQVSATSGYEWLWYGSMGSCPFPLPMYLLPYYLYVPEVLFPAFFRVGDDWSGSNWIGGTAYGGTSWAITDEARVSAGDTTYQQCLHIETVVTGPHSFGVGTRHAWFAPGVGLVRLLYKHQEGSETHAELLSGP